MAKKSTASAKGRCEVCGNTEALSVAECTCGAVLTVCEECYGERESAEGGGLLVECPECEADEREEED